MFLVNSLIDDLRVLRPDYVINPYGTGIKVKGFCKIAFRLLAFPSTCGAATISSYAIYPDNTGKSWQKCKLSFEKEDLVELKFILTQMFNSKYRGVGGLIACNPNSTINDTHFLRLAGFMPLAGWGNLHHDDRATHVWVKVLRQPKTGEPTNALPEQLIQKANDSKISLAAMLTKEKENIEEVISRPRDSRGRFVKKS